MSEIAGNIGLGVGIAIALGVVAVVVMFVRWNAARTRRRESQRRADDDARNRGA